MQAYSMAFLYTVDFSDKSIRFDEEDMSVVAVITISRKAICNGYRSRLVGKYNRAEKIVIPFCHGRKEHKYRKCGLAKGQNHTP